MVKNMISNKKGFFKCIGQKRQAKKGIPPSEGVLASTDMEKTKVLSEFFALFFIDQVRLPMPLMALQF